MSWDGVWMEFSAHKAPHVNLCARLWLMPSLLGPGRGCALGWKLWSQDCHTVTSKGPRSSGLQWLTFKWSGFSVQLISYEKQGGGGAFFSSLEDLNPLPPSYSYLVECSELPPSRHTQNVPYCYGWGSQQACLGSLDSTYSHLQWSLLGEPCGLWLSDVLPPHRSESPCFMSRKSPLRDA